MAHRYISALVLLFALLGLRAGEVGFIEDFALADDRAATLDKLVPGSDDHFFYRILLAQHQDELEQAEELLQEWRAHLQRRRQNHSRYDMLLRRQLVLRSAAGSAPDLTRLANELKVKHHHQREGAEPPQVFPVRLDPNRVDWPAFRQAARTRGGASFLSLMTDSGLRRLMEEGYAWTPRQRNEILSRLHRADHPALLPLVVADLNRDNSPGFGSQQIHAGLDLDQLTALAEAWPAVRQSSDWVAACIARLAPPEHLDVEADAAERLAWLQRLQALADALPALHDGLKAQILHQRLLHDRRAGVVDAERLLAYLSFPRQAAYAHPRWLRQPEVRARMIQPRESFPKSQLPAIGDDSALVHDLLRRVLAGAASPDMFAEVVDQAYLQRVFVEAQVLAGIGRAEEWLSRIDNPAWSQALQERIDLEFAPDHQHNFSPDEDPVLTIETKGIDSLLVHIYELDALNVLRASDREINLDLDLDGLVANHELRFDYDDHPLRRLRREIALPQLRGRGVAIVEFIGNGKRLRALVQRGELQVVERIAAAGQVFSILDEQRQPLKGGRIWLRDRSFAAREDGSILIPFAAEASDRSIIVAHQGLARRHDFRHQAEAYELEMGLHIERESLLTGREATLLLRPNVTMHGEPVALSLLEQARVTIVATDNQGIASTSVLEDVALSRGQEFSHTFRVSEHLRQLEVKLSGRVRQLADGQYQDLQAVYEHQLADHEDSTLTDAAHLQRSVDGWVLQVLGRSGEPRPDQILAVKLWHANTTEPITEHLRTDAHGRSYLGALPEIHRLAVQQTVGDPGWSRQWNLAEDQPVLPEQLHLASGAELRLPWSQGPESLNRVEVSLTAQRNGFPVSDHFAALEWENGFLVARDLPPGSYRFLAHRQDMAVQVTIGGSEVAEGWLANGKDLRQRSPAPLQMTDLSLEGDTLSAQLHGMTAHTRVHIIATVFEPQFQADDALALSPIALPRLYLPPQPSHFSHSVALGDEERYILERRDAERRPGVMLPRPSLLIHPWQLPEHTMAVGAGVGAAGAYGSRSGGGRRRALGAYGGSRDSGMGRLDPSLDFLPQAPLLLSNLRPEADGSLRVQLPELQGLQQLRLLVVDDQRVVQGRLALGEQELNPRDLRVQQADTNIPRIQRQRLSILQAGEELRLEHALGAEVELIDSVGALWRHLSSLSTDKRLAPFALLGRWDQLETADKIAFYEEHACHELRLFLYHHDQPFFTAVVAPLLAHKLSPTFLDHYLRDEELAPYLEPWRWDRLNYLERALLAHRQPAAADGIRLWLDQAVALLPPQAERQQRIIATALRGRALQREDRSQLRREMARSSRVAPSAPSVQALADSVDMPVVAVELAAEEPAIDRLARSQADAADRDTLRGLYRGPGSTHIWAEHNYYQRRQVEQDGRLLPMRRLWRDWARHQADEAFLSPGLLEADASVHEALLALALADLPLSPGNHQIERDGHALRIRAATPLIVVQREIAPLADVEEPTLVVMSQNAYRMGERHRMVDGESVDHFLRDEFVIHTPYASEVVISNPSSTRRRMDLLTLLPTGAMPLAGSRASFGRPLVLEPYESTRVELAFYFPAPGTFPMPGASVAQDGEALAWTQGLSFPVVQEASHEDRDSWAWISQHAAAEDVLAWLTTSNLQEINLGRMAWRMRDEDFFHAALAIVHQRRAYHPVLWGYAFLHRDRPRIAQFLAQSPDFLRQLGPRLVSSLIDSQPVERVWYEHLEFAPLVNVRAHRMGRRPWIANHQQAAHYDALLQRLAFTPQLTADDRLEAAYHLILQDRITEAATWFESIERDQLRSHMPYDYAAAWLAFANRDLAAAQAIAETYVDLPMAPWRERFAAIRAQVAEIRGGQVTVGDHDLLEQRHTGLAASEPELSLRQERGELRLNWQNLDQVEVRYHLLDVELRFSRAPFAKNERRAPLTAPNQHQQLDLPADASSLRLELPPEIAQRNVLVEVVGAGLRASEALLASAMQVQPVAAYGQLRVRHDSDRRPLDTVYVKVYRRMSGGEIAFHKDGYTDLRGRFDYASVNDLDYRQVEAFAVLVLSDEHGAVILELPAPTQ